jgi:Tfp pilus assembly protein PilF
VVGVAVVALALAVAWKYWPARTDGRAAGPEDADPRLTFSTPYRNVRPEVQYVGDQACAGCHAEQARSYRDHPMGRALAPVAAATPIERYELGALNPFEASGLRYDVWREGGRVFHRERSGDPTGPVLTETEAEVRFAVGSGARARSYLIDHGGYLFQSPLTWYPHGGRWDLSPGYERQNQHFGRPVAPGCLFCHSNHAEHVPDTVNRYRQPIFRGHAIGCERCHGPGELHVKRRGDGDMAPGPDDTIVNPARLDHALREDVCHQCHLQGEERVPCRGRSEFDYRPGLPLRLFMMDFIDGREHGSDAKFVNSVEQLTASRCYRASREPNKLGCISCHDPHRQPAPQDRVAHYRERCLRCHAEQSCTLPPAARREKEDSCIACHMPRTGSEVTHTSITDHRIPRHAGGPVPAAAAVRPVPGPDDLTLFPRGCVDPRDEEASRNLGVALIAMLSRKPPDDVARQFAAKALPLLTAAVSRDGHDWGARQAAADALWWLGRQEEALAAYVTILAAKPESERALQGAGTVALEMNRPEAARRYLERAVRVNPWRWHYHHQLALASFRLGEWERGTRECRESLRLGPTNAWSRSLLVQCYLALGRDGEARAEFETLLRLTPADRREQKRAWFEEQSRRLAPAR